MTSTLDTLDALDNVDNVIIVIMASLNFVLASILVDQCHVYYLKLKANKLIGIVNDVQCP